MRRYAWFASLTVTLAILLGQCIAQEATLAPPPRAPFQLQGAASCSAAACHNGDAISGTHGREFAVALARDSSSFASKDKHAQAFQVLFEPRSKAIQQKLEGLKTLDEARPESNALCLRCHVHPQFDRPPVRTIDNVRQFRLEDGVSCEACHGPAQGWLAEHFRPGWSELSASAKLARGMRDTQSLPGRIGLCVECHVGGPNMDVNHDLIAAGHPRLAFEFSSFHFTMHKHWDGAKEGTPDFEARAWQLGQLASALAALKLLAHRAADDRVWPEFAEYDCASCHHDLRAKSWRKTPERRLGTPLWNHWYTAGLGAALPPTAAGIDKQLKELRVEMEKPLPDRALVARKAHAAADGLTEALEELERKPAIPLELFTRRLFEKHLGTAPRSWDEASQFSHAFDSLERTRPGLHNPTAAKELKRLLRSARDFDPTAVGQALDSLRERPR